MPEWLNGTDSKSVVRFRRTVGSNPTLSSIANKNIFYILFYSFIFSPVSQIQEEKHSFSFSSFVSWFNKNQTFLTSLALSLVAGVMFLILNFSESLYRLNNEGREIFSVRIWTLVLLLTYVFGTYIICFLQGWKLWHALSTWLQSNILVLLALAFMFRLNKTPLDLFGFSVSTGMVFVPLTILVFLVNFNMFGKRLPKLSLTFSQVLLFFVQAFSLINFLVDNKASTLTFREPLVEYIFGLNVYVWLIICALAVTVVSIFNLKITEVKQRWQAGIIFFVLIFQGLFAVNSLNLDSYWYKTLLMLIFWDFLYSPYKVIFEKRLDPHFMAKLSISIFYHTALLILVVLWYFFGIR